MREIVVADIGGTHARFAIATIGGDEPIKLGQIVTLKCSNFASLQTAWHSFGEQIGRELPRAAAIALATPIKGDVLKMTNNPWVIRPALVKEKLDVDQFILVNDFGAIGHAVQHVSADDLTHLCGPQKNMPGDGIVTIVGPGTGLGVSMLLRLGENNDYRVVETEAGHIDFAPLDSIEDFILARLRKDFTRVSVERVVSGPAIVTIYNALAALENRAVAERSDVEIWSAALDGNDELAEAALDRFCMCLGAVAGDFALVHGASNVVIAGGLGHRIAHKLKQSGFVERFHAKGRFKALMENISVDIISHPQPGLLGCAAAFQKKYPSTGRK
ncbi:glucokinase [Sphingorhabdus lutea]|uniref:Glucokinase n=1 Tax=Sphingorhabdus lutea TaxID=1913578 RepID=A0A1L3JET8_9SPHN|nr:glucokinase [Sphingorhabdus lutea]